MAQSVVVVLAGEDNTKATFDAVKAHLSETKHAAEEAENAFGKLGERLKSALETAGIYFGLEEIKEGLVDAVKEAAEFGEAISQAREKTGLAAGTLSVFHYAADATGTDFQALAGAASKLGRNLADAADGNKKMADTFQAAGINARDLAGRSDGVEIALQRLAKTYIATESPARRNQLLMETLGKAGAQLGPVLAEVGANFDEFKDKAQAAGVYLDEIQANTLRQFNDKLIDMKEKVLGAELQFTQGFIPAVRGVGTAFSEGTKGENLFSEAGKVVGEDIKALTGYMVLLGGSLNATQKLFLGLGDTAHSILLAIGADLKGDFKGSDNFITKAVADAKRALADANAEADKTHAKLEALAHPPAEKPEEHVPGTGGFGGVGDPEADKAREAELRKEQEFLEKMARLGIGNVTDGTGLNVSALSRAQQSEKLLDASHKDSQDSLKNLIEQEQQEWTKGAEDAERFAQRQVDALTRVQEQALRTADNKFFGAERDASFAEATGEISPQQRIAAVRDAAEQEYQEKRDALIKLAAIDEELNPNNPEKLQRDQDEIEELTERHNSAMVALDQEAVLQQRAVREGLLRDVLDPLFDRPKSISEAFKQMEDNVIRSLSHIAEQKLMDEILGGNSGGPLSESLGLPAGGKGGIGGILGGLIGRIGGGKGASNGGVPTGAGTVATDIAAKLGAGGTSGGGGSITIINQTSQPVAAASSSSSQDQFGNMVKSIILKDADSGGPISAAISGAGKMFFGG